MYGLKTRNRKGSWLLVAQCHMLHLSSSEPEEKEAVRAFVYKLLEGRSLPMITSSRCMMSSIEECVSAKKILESRLCRWSWRSPRLAFHWCKESQQLQGRVHAKRSKKRSKEDQSWTACWNLEECGKCLISCSFNLFSPTWGAQVLELQELQGLGIQKCFQRWHLLWRGGVYCRCQLKYLLASCN